MVTSTIAIKSGPITIFSTNILGTVIMYDLVVIVIALEDDGDDGVDMKTRSDAHCTMIITILTTIITIFITRSNAQLAPRALLNKRRGGVGWRV